MLDIGIVLSVGLFMINSYHVGFLEEILAVISLLVSTIGAYILSPYLVPYITFFTDNAYTLRIIAAVIIFIIIYLSLKIIRDGIFDFLKESSFSAVDRGLGVVLGLAKGLIFASFVIFILYQIDFDPLKHALQGSFLGNILLETFWKYKSLALAYF